MSRSACGNRVHGDALDRHGRLGPRSRNRRRPSVKPTSALNSRVRRSILLGKILDEQDACRVHRHVHPGPVRLRRGGHRRPCRRCDDGRRARHRLRLRPRHRRDGLWHRLGLGLPRQSGGERRRLDRRAHADRRDDPVRHRPMPRRDRRHGRALPDHVRQGVGMGRRPRRNGWGPGYLGEYNTCLGAGLRGGRDLPLPHHHPRRDAEGTPLHIAGSPASPSA